MVAIVCSAILNHHRMFLNDEHFYHPVLRDDGGERYSLRPQPPASPVPSPGSKGSSGLPPDLRDQADQEEDQENRPHAGIWLAHQVKTYLILAKLHLS